MSAPTFTLGTGTDTIQAWTTPFNLVYAPYTPQAPTAPGGCINPNATKLPKPLYTPSFTLTIPTTSPADVVRGKMAMAETKALKQEEDFDYTSYLNPSPSPPPQTQLTDSSHRNIPPPPPPLPPPGPTDIHLPPGMFTLADRVKSRRRGCTKTPPPVPQPLPAIVATSPVHSIASNASSEMMDVCDYGPPSSPLTEAKDEPTSDDGGGDLDSPYRPTSQRAGVQAGQARGSRHKPHRRDPEKRKTQNRDAQKVYRHKKKGIAELHYLGFLETLLEQLALERQLHDTHWEDSPRFKRWYQDFHAVSPREAAAFREVVSRGMAGIGCV